MDHAEARELLDLAAVEPGGLDRLVAGDTPTATALAGHLAGCPDCTEEFSRLRRTATILREVIATQPSPELRARTLAFVAAVGRPREAPGSPLVAGAAGAGAAGASVVTPLDQVLSQRPAGNGPSAERPAVERSSAERPVAERPVAKQPAAERRLAERRRPGGPLAWLAVAAALVLVSVGATAFLVSSQDQAATRSISLELAGLTKVAQWTMRLDALPDVRHVTLTGPAPGGAGPELVGTLIFSPGTRQLVIMADGLSRPPSGKEYRCWVELGGSRERLGKMYVSGDLAYWVGDAEALATVAPGSVFGISLVDTAGGSGPSPTLLSGTLQST